MTKVNLLKIYTEMAVHFFSLFNIVTNLMALPITGSFTVSTPERFAQILLCDIMVRLRHRANVGARKVSIYKSFHNVKKQDLRKELRSAFCIRPWSKLLISENLTRFEATNFKFCVLSVLICIDKTDAKLFEAAYPYARDL